MFRILIADDEPIILSGIRHLIDWENADAEIIGSARNGAEAWSIIESEHPDIVITDIKMPLMDGLALVEKCADSYPRIVFIILTSLAEFSLAREAVGYGVSDYLLKTELDEKTLLSALEKAESESVRRSATAGSFQENNDDRLSSEILNLLLLRQITAETRNLLSHSDVLSSYAFIAAVYQFPAESFDKEWDAEDYRKLHGWEEDVLLKVIHSFSENVYPVTAPSGRQSSFIYLVSGISRETWAAVSSRLEEKVRSAAGMVTGLDTNLLHTAVYSGSDSLQQSRSELEALLMAYYLEKEPASVKPAPLVIGSVFPTLELAIREKDRVGCRASFAEIRRAVSSSDHSLSQLEFMIVALRSAVMSGLASIGLSESDEITEMFSASDFISRRSEALLFLDDIESGLLDIVESTGGSGSGIADKAREYILMHITEHIALSDVAAYACVSPGYMSKSFKRIMGISLVDYINQKKVEKAKEMMAEGNERIADIALALGFSNIYYFSKVFRKMEGIPPTEYIKNRAKSEYK